jgi:hypothetical protein
MGGNWWTRSQSIRTEGEVPFEVALKELAEPSSYLKISEDAKRLHQLGINSNRIALFLNVDRTTVGRAHRAIEGKPMRLDRETP